MGLGSAQGREFLRESLWLKQKAMWSFFKHSRTYFINLWLFTHPPSFFFTFFFHFTLVYHKLRKLHFSLLQTEEGEIAISLEYIEAPIQLGPHHCYIIEHILPNMQPKR